MYFVVFTIFLCHSLALDVHYRFYIVVDILTTTFHTTQEVLLQMSYPIGARAQGVKLAELDV